MIILINTMDQTISSSSSPVTKCRQASTDVILSTRRRTELRRLKVGNDCVPKRRRNSSDHDNFPHHTSVIGRRREMEDAVSVEVDFVNVNSVKFDFYGVYDGHGGSGVANVCRERLHKVVAAEMVAAGNVGVGVEEVDWEGLMVDSFVKMDEEVSEKELGGSMGSTAVVAVVCDKVMVVANCGDSRAVLSRGGSAVPLSVDHKPDRPDELDRIEKSGGRVVEWNGQRVLGILATSRSIGDGELKPYVIPKPEIIVTKREDNDEFIILASDGLWDVISNDVACHVVKKCLQGRIVCSKRSHDNKYRMMNATLVLTELAMARGSRDNISVIVVNLKTKPHVGDP